MNIKAEYGILLKPKSTINFYGKAEIYKKKCQDIEIKKFRKKVKIS